MTRPKLVKEGFQGSGLTAEEQKIGSVKFNEYKKNYPQLNKHSNLQLLEELVWLECLQDRFKKQVGECTKGVKDDKGVLKVQPVPGHLQSSISDNLAQIMDLKTKLGLFEDQQSVDAYKDLEALRKKAEQWRLEHPLSYKTTCPHCTKIFFLKRSTEGYDSFVSPFYADDKVLKNTPLRNLWLNKKITKAEYAEVLNVHADYVDWLEDKVYKTGVIKEV